MTQTNGSHRSRAARHAPPPGPVVQAMRTLREQRRAEAIEEAQRLASTAALDLARVAFLLEEAMMAGVPLLGHAHRWAGLASLWAEYAESAVFAYRGTAGVPAVEDIPPPPDPSSPEAGMEARSDSGLHILRDNSEGGDE